MERENKLKKVGKVLRMVEILFVISLMFLCGIYISHYVRDKKMEKSVNYGQVWIYTDDAENPYEKNLPRTRLVLDVNGNYVQFVNIFNDTLTVSRKEFIKDSRRLNLE